MISWIFIVIHCFSLSWFFTMAARRIDPNVGVVLAANRHPRTGRRQSRRRFARHWPAGL
jgi:hypothetical protein